MKLLEKNIGIILYGLGFVNRFSNLTTKSKATKIIDKLVFIKIKNIYASKHISKKVKKKKPIKWKKKLQIIFWVKI